MKKGFFKSLFASFSPAICLLFSLFIMALVYIGIGGLSTNGSIAAQRALVQGVAVTYLLCMSLSGLSGLKDKRISFFDFARFTAAVGTLLGVILAVATCREQLGVLEVIYYLVNFACITTQVVFRIIYCREDSDYSGPKAFFSSLVAKFDLLILLGLAVFTSFIVILFFNYDVKFFEKLRSIIFGAAIGYLLVQIVLIKTVKHNKTNIIDVLTILGIIVVGISFAFDGDQIPTRVGKIGLIIVFMVAALLIFRALIFKGKPIDPKLGSSKYYKTILLKYDVVFAGIIAFLMLYILIAPQSELVEYLYYKTGLIGYHQMLIQYGPFILLAVDLAFIIIIICSRGFRSSKARLTDFALLPMTFFAFFSVPYLGYMFFQYLKFKDLIIENPTIWCSVVTVIVNIILVAVLLPNRISSFNYDYEADAKEFLEDDDEFFADHEYKKREQVVDTQEAPVVEEEQQQTEQVDLSEFEFDESLINAPVVNQLPQYDLDADAEFLAYLEAMEEQGTPIDLDADAEYEEQIIYVDEFGNEVEGPFENIPEEEAESEPTVNNLDDAQADFIRQFGAVNTDGEQSVEAALEFIRKYEEAMGITHVENLTDDSQNNPQEEDEEDDEDDSENDLEPEDDGTPVEEELLSDTNTREKNIIIPEFQILDENGAPKKIKRKFSNRMMFAPLEAKQYYNEIKNYFMMYRATSRYSARCETFRYKGLIAKVSLAGKSIKVNLALNPSDLEGTKYKFKDVSMKKQYVEVPVMIKVRSQRGLKHFKELVDYMMAARLVKPKANFTPVDYLPQLVPNGEAILATIGLSTDYLYNTINVRGIPTDLPDNLEEYLPVIPGTPIDGEPVEAVVYIDTLSLNFNDGDIITLESLKELHVVERGNFLHVKARGTLDRKITVYADKFDPDALKMLMCTNCIAVKVQR